MILSTLVSKVPTSAPEHQHPLLKTSAEPPRRCLVPLLSPQARGWWGEEWGMHCCTPQVRLTRAGRPCLQDGQALESYPNPNSIYTALVIHKTPGKRRYFSQHENSSNLSDKLSHASPAPLCSLLSPPHNPKLLRKLPELQGWAVRTQPRACQRCPHFPVLQRGFGCPRAAPCRRLLRCLGEGKTKAGKQKVHAHGEQQTAKGSSWQLRCYFLHPDPAGYLQQGGSCMLEVPRRRGGTGSRHGPAVAQSPAQNVLSSPSAYVCSCWFQAGLQRYLNTVFCSFHADRIIFF